MAKTKLKALWAQPRGGGPGRCWGVPACRRETDPDTAHPGCSLGVGGEQREQPGLPRVSLERLPEVATFSLSQAGVHYPGRGNSMSLKAETGGNAPQQAPVTHRAVGVRGEQGSWLAPRGLEWGSEGSG